MKHLHKLPYLLLFLLAVALSFKSLREPDLWWQIRTGEWILQNGQVPTHDVFSYTYNGAEWINVKWGSEVLYAAVSKAAGPESVFLIQALVACLLLYVLLKTAQSRGYNMLPVAVAALFTLPALEYRINGRPEMFSHLFTAVFIYFLWRYRQQPSKAVYWLVPLQLLWANLHEAFGVGWVLLGIFTLSAWAEYWLANRKLLALTPHKPVALTLTAVAAVAVVLLNPNGVKLLTRPLQLLGQVYENKYTTELFNFTNPDYWQWNIYLVLVLVAIAKAGWLWQFFTTKTKGNKWQWTINQLGLGYLLTLAAFFYLAGTAYRNVVFLVIALFPVLAGSLHFLWQKLPALQRRATVVSAALVVLLLGAYGLVVSNQYYLLTNSRDRFGLEVLSTQNPVGAANFVRQNNIQGKCFSDYLTSSYLLWKLQPDFKTFIDLRDLDVFPPTFFNTFAEAVTFSDSFRQLDSAQNFDYAIVFRPQFISLHQFLMARADYQLAFIDPVAAVFVKGGISGQAPPAFTPAQPVPVSGIATIANKLLNPFYQPFNYSTVDNDYLAAAYYNSTGKHALAEEYALKAVANGIEDYKDQQLLGEINYGKAMMATTPDDKTQLLNTAGNYYQQCINTQPNFAPAYLGLGAIYFQQRNVSMALSSFEKAITLDPTALNAYLFAAECAKHFVNLNNAESGLYADKAIGFYEGANRYNPNNPNIMLNLGFLYYRQGNCKKSTAYLKRVEGFNGLNPTEQQQVRDCLQKCGG